MLVNYIVYSMLLALNCVVTNWVLEIEIQLYPVLRRIKQVLPVRKTIVNWKYY